MVVLLELALLANLPEDPPPAPQGALNLLLRLPSIFPPECRGTLASCGLEQAGWDLALSIRGLCTRHGSPRTAPGNRPGGCRAPGLRSSCSPVRHRDRVVSKDELLATVWHGRIVSESALFNRINAARSAHRRHRRRTAADQDAAAQGPSLRRRCPRGRGGHRQSARMSTPRRACRHCRFPTVPRSRCCPSPI